MGLDRADDARHWCLYPHLSAPQKAYSFRSHPSQIRSSKDSHLISGGFLPFQQRYPELCESALCESSSLAAGESLTAYLPLLSLNPTDGEQNQGHYYNNLNLHLQANSPDVSMHSQAPAEKLCVEVPSPLEAKLERQQLSRSSNVKSSDDRGMCFRLGPAPQSASITERQSPLMKMPCSMSQPCFRSFQVRF